MGALSRFRKNSNNILFTQLWAQGQSSCKKQVITALWTKENTLFTDIYRIFSLSILLVSLLFCVNEDWTAANLCGVYTSAQCLPVQCSLWLHSNTKVPAGFRLLHFLSAGPQQSQAGDSPACHCHFDCHCHSHCHSSLSLSLLLLLWLLLWLSLSLSLRLWLFLYFLSAHRKETLQQI